MATTENLDLVHSEASTATVSPTSLWIAVGLAVGVAILAVWSWVGMSSHGSPPANPDAQVPVDYPPPAASQSAANTTSRATALRTSDLAAWPHSSLVQVVSRNGRPTTLQLCQYCEPALTGVDCASGPGCREPRWSERQPLPLEVFAQGDYIGPARDRHVGQYRLRVDDEVEFIFRLTREMSFKPYQLNVGDQIRVESFIDPKLDRDLVIQPDGTITLRMLGQLPAARRTVEELRDEVEQQYRKYYNVPAITVTPVQVNTKLEDLRATVDARAGAGGQNLQARITPEGTVQLPALVSVPAQGLTLDELKREIDERYAQIVDGIEVTPRLIARAPRFVYVLGEVRLPGRYTLEAPTTVMQSIALAGGWNNGGNLREVVVFRRAADWHLVATKLDIRGALLGKRPCPADEIWLRDSDIVVVPKSALLLADDFIELVFTRGIYGVIPLQGVSLNFSKASTL